MQLSDFLVDKGLIIIPVLYIIGKIVKNIEIINDKYIPLILLAVGVIAATGIMGLSVSSVVQGVLLAGAAVFGNQIVKQFSMSE